MRILITGATGFVGSRLVARLAGQGHEVVVLSRDAARAAERLPLAAACHSWTPSAGPPLLEALRGVDAVVHLAGESVVGRWTRAKKRAIEESRVLGTRHLVQAMHAQDRPPAVLVSASAIGFYGDRGDEVLAEDAPAGDDLLARVCRGWEEAATAAESFGTRVVRLRIGLVLDPAGGALQAMLRPFRLGLGGPLGDGQQWWAWIHLEDLLALIERSLSDEAWRGPINATAPHPARQVELARTLGRVLGRPAFLPGPRVALKLALGGFSTELLSSRRVVPRAALAGGFEFAHPQLEDALRDLLTPAR